MLGVWAIFIFIFIYFLIFQNMYIQVFIIRNRVSKYLNTKKNCHTPCMHASLIYNYVKNIHMAKKTNPGQNFSPQKTRCSPDSDFSVYICIFM